jgi:hypothetical protein
MHGNGVVAMAADVDNPLGPGEYDVPSCFGESVVSKQRTWLQKQYAPKRKELYGREFCKLQRKIEQEKMRQSQGRHATRETPDNGGVGLLNVMGMMMEQPGELAPPALWHNLCLLACLLASHT